MAPQRNVSNTDNMIAQARTSESDRDSASIRPAVGEESAPEMHPLEPLLKHLAELREFALYYLEARTDQARVVVRRVLMRLALFAVVGLLGLVVIAAALVLALYGLSEILDAALGSHSGAGKLVVGCGTVLAAYVVGRVALGRMNQSTLQQTRRKYELRHEAQRTKFGEDVPQRAS